MNKENLLRELEQTHNYFMTSVSELKAEHADFKPQDGMLSVKQHVAHVAQSVDWFVDGAFSELGFDMNFEDHWSEVNEVQSLEDALKKVSEAFAKAKEILASKTEEQLSKPLLPGMVMPGEPTYNIVGGIVDHTAHHRGALTVYIRLLGAVPKMPYL